MGRILSVRVSAATYNEDDVFRTWPRLCSLAWPGKGRIWPDGWKLDPVSFASPVASDPVRRGAVELVQGILEEFRLGDWDAAITAQVQDEMKNLAVSMGKLDQALGDWQPQAANAVTNEIEDSLDSLEEKLAGTVPF